MTRCLTPRWSQRRPPREFWIEPWDLRVQIAVESQPPAAIVQLQSVTCSTLRFLIDNAVEKMRSVFCSMAFI